MLRKKATMAMLALMGLFALNGASAWAAADLEEGVKDLADKITKNMIEKSKHKIAIVDFSDLNGNVNALGQFMAEELTTQLFMLAPGKFEVVERRQLLKLEEELILGQIGVLEEKGLKQMGKVLGVEAIVTGSMTDLGQAIKVNARMIAVDTAKVFAVAATSIPKTGIVAELASKPAERKAGVVAKPTVAQQSVPKTGKESVFENEFLKVTARPVKKQGKGATLVVLYENLGDVPYKMGYHETRNTYLLDEDGNRWDFQSDTVNVSSGVVLVPKTKLHNRITFQSIGESGGHFFTFVSGVDFFQMIVNNQWRGPSGRDTITINEIPAE